MAPPIVGSSWNALQIEERPSSDGLLEKKGAENVLGSFPSLGEVGES